MKSSLRTQFLVRIFIVMIVTALLTGLIQLYFINDQIAEQTKNQASLISLSVESGLKETLVAAKSIEHQIDLKMISYSKHIAEILKGKSVEEIDEELLQNVKEEIGVSGITIFAKRDDDIVGVVSTEPEEIGFSMKKVGFLEVGEIMLQGGKAPVPGATFIDHNIVVLPIAQSASHNEIPSFFKYAYYHPPGSEYVINPYIEADEVNRFIEEVGPNTWISEMVSDNPYLSEIAILAPEVFVDPKLEEKIYPPKKKVVYGQFNHYNEDDINIIKKMAVHREKVSFVQDINGQKLYKTYLPIGDNFVVYTSLDYGKLSGPLYRHSLILIFSGLLSLFALFFLTAKFFNRVYINIQKIKSQLLLLEAGDLTAKSDVNDRNELGTLSDSANNMVDHLRKLIHDTTEHAKNVQRTSAIVEAEASQSVEKMYQLSTEATAKSREHLYSIMDFLESMEEFLQTLPASDKKDELLKSIDEIKKVAHDRTAATTDLTLSLSDLLKSLHHQSSQLSKISNLVLHQMAKFKLN